MSVLERTREFESCSLGEPLRLLGLMLLESMRLASPRHQRQRARHHAGTPRGQTWAR
jgi:hypothetical protein